MSLNVGLYNKINDKREACCLCFQNINDINEALQVKDEIALAGFDGTRELYEILLFVLGVEIEHTIDGDDYICCSCQQSTLQSYNFIKMCRENAKNLTTSINKLSNALENIDDDIDCKSIFITLNPAKIPTKVYYNYRKLPTTQPLNTALFKRLQNLIKESKIKLEVEVDFQSDFFNDSGDDTLKTTEYIIINNPKKTKKLRQSSKRKALEEIACDNNPFQCRFCLKVLASTRHLRYHYYRSHAPKEFQCSECSKEFAKMAYLKEHIENCHKPAICYQCGKTFKTKKYLRLHETIHSGPTMCTKCGKSYKSISTFKTHICQAKKVKLEKVFPCELCGKKFGRPASVRKHKSFAHNGKAHSCSWCGKKWASPAALKSHLVTHTQEKNFSCETCGGKFVTKASLLCHTRIHTGEKPYKCEICDKTFLSASRRMDHLRFNHMAAKFTCDLCGSKFRSKACLRRHANRHSNPKSKLYCIEK